MKLNTLAVLAASGTVAAARRFRRSENALETRATDATYEAHTIDQPIDHFPHSSRYAPHETATFKQRYFFDSSYYKPGGPVFLYISGETSGESRFSNLKTGIIKILMEATNGLGVILENRYYGHSYPYNTSSTDELRFLTTEQTIADNAYFAQHAKFPGVNASLNAPNTPWILYGGSLAGAQTAFSLKEYGGDDGLLWAGIASSGTTKGEYEYPQWYDPIQKYGPQDCVGRLNGIVDNMDKVFASNNQTAIYKLKEIFGFEGLKDDRDFAYTIAFPLGGPVDYGYSNTWQELSWFPEDGAQDFWHFCSNVTNDDAHKNISLVDYALSEFSHGEPWTGLGNYAHYVKQTVLPSYGASCAEVQNQDSSDCFGQQNATHWADISNNGGRSYLYSSCTESGGYQTARLQGPSLLSRIIQKDYTQQWCTWAFPAGKHNQIPSRPQLETQNKYGGFSVIQKRLAHIDGDQDVWNDICYHSTRAPKRRTSSAKESVDHPELLITGAGHHWDSYGYGALEDQPQFIREAHYWEIRTVKRWVEEFKSKPKGYRAEL
ncbi:extracelular serine carboxypeptidase [Acrodontium crateriforme]|uniref:Extracelular serine carboxypeptidase n=1 Tax=Acrodontium crateriforme TaxID=150365 RepID=A0AAQ3M8K0_9PEZI|nr:extracelular serine carboxypeptidase [Acrodontium crateriforme]